MQWHAPGYNVGNNSMTRAMQELSTSDVTTILKSFALLFLIYYGILPLTATPHSKPYSLELFCSSQPGQHFFHFCALSCAG